MNKNAKQKKTKTNKTNKQPQNRELQRTAATGVFSTHMGPASRPPGLPKRVAGKSEETQTFSISEELRIASPRLS